MPKNAQKTEPKAVIEDDGLDHDPVYTFDQFKYAPNRLGCGDMDEIPSYAICDLVNHTIDVANGAALIFRIIEDHQTQLECRRPMLYLNDFHLEKLTRLAAISLDSLETKASELAMLLRKAERGQP